MYYFVSNLFVNWITCYWVIVHKKWKFLRHCLPFCSDKKTFRSKTILLFYLINSHSLHFFLYFRVHIRSVKKVMWRKIIDIEFVRDQTHGPIIIIFLCRYFFLITNFGTKQNITIFFKLAPTIFIKFCSIITSKSPQNILDVICLRISVCNNYKNLSWAVIMSQFFKVVSLILFKY